ncbi:MAG: flagellar basal-body rod protein FlgG [Rhodospirillaceae bacterium]|jgi:flagellar basal-body rod protein FlgG|nr:flagellar basal-body rod protein FlgG [Rhodospirillaceae bacterium]
MRALTIAATGMLAQQTNVEVISNNIANLNTTAYKRSRVEFQDLLYQDQRRVGSASSEAGTIVPAGLQVGLGVRAAAVYRLNQQGTLQLTENTLDLGIRGEGFFNIQLPNGQTAYTRSGSFQLSPTGQIVTQDGYPVLPGITVPQNTLDISINAAGQAYAKLDGVVQPQLLGQFTLSNFPNVAGLESIGQNLMLQTPASGAPVAGTAGALGFGTMQQGFLEASNVNAVAEITNLITAQRAYELNSKVIQSTDDMMGIINQLK